MKVLIVAEHDNKQLRPINLHTLSAATLLSSQIDILVIGWQCATIVKELQQFSQIKRVLAADDEIYQHQLAENVAPLIAELAKSYDYILMGSSTFSKNSLPRVAALLDVQMIADVIKIISSDTFMRPIYAGDALETIQSVDKQKVITIRSTAFPAAIKQQSTATIETIAINIPNVLSTFVAQQLTASTRPELTSAKVIVSGGRGLKSAENFKLIEELADVLGAAIGASRAAVDAGFVPNDYQVGQTGKIVAPDLYIAIGISGAIQHLAGMKDSKCIVAINNDPDAPIFQVADYGLVGDLFKVLPELANELTKRN